MQKAQCIHVSKQDMLCHTCPDFKWTVTSAIGDARNFDFVIVGAAVVTSASKLNLLISYV